MPVPKDIDMYMGNCKESTQMHVQYPYIAMSPDLCIPLTKSHLNLYTCIRVVYYWDNAHILRHRSDQTAASAIYYQMDTLIRVILFTTDFAIDLGPEPSTHDVGDLILLLTLTNQ